MDTAAFVHQRAVSDRLIIEKILNNVHCVTTRGPDSLGSVLVDKLLDLCFGLSVWPFLFFSPWPVKVE